MRVGAGVHTLWCPWAQQCHEQAESARQEDSSVTGHRLGNSLTCAGIKRFTLSSRSLPIAFRSSYAIHSQTTTQAAISVLWVHNGHHHGYVCTILSTLSKSSTTIQHRKRLYPYQTCGSEKNVPALSHPCAHFSQTSSCCAFLKSAAALALASFCQLKTACSGKKRSRDQYSKNLRMGAFHQPPGTAPRVSPHTEAHAGRMFSKAGAGLCALGCGVLCCCITPPVFSASCMWNTLANSVPGRVSVLAARM